MGGKLASITCARPPSNITLNRLGGACCPTALGPDRSARGDERGEWAGRGGGGVLGGGGGLVDPSSIEMPIGTFSASWLGCAETDVGEMLSLTGRECAGVGVLAARDCDVVVFLGGGGGGRALRIAVPLGAGLYSMAGGGCILPLSGLT